jgi:ubiquinone/menaquinone biosynthesis C-methylase UbiE
VDFLIWLGIFALLILIGYLLDREVYFYEGAHLGPKVQAWLYDRWARKYDEGKRESQLRDDEMLAQPLLAALQDVPEPFILDFATGTGRLSHALLDRPEFKGHIVALDLSQGMLEQAASKLSRRPDRVEFVRHQSLPLPFPDAAFDAVCALEALELFPNMEKPLAELARVLRPGGVLLTSRGTEESGRKAKVKSRLEFALLLTQNSFETFQILPWWKLFDRVIAAKNGFSTPVEKRALKNVLKCPACGKIRWERKPNSLNCRECGRGLSVTDSGILLN